MKQKFKSWMWPTIALVALGLLISGLLLAQGTFTDVPVKIQPNGDGTVNVWFHGEAGRSYDLQFTEDMQNWSTAAASVVATSGWTEWVDTQKPASGQRYYRVIVQSTTNAAARVTQNAIEKADAQRLIAALTSGDYASVLGILGAYGVNSNTLTAMSARLGQSPARSSLNESFLTGMVGLSLGGTTTNVQSGLAAAQAQGCKTIYWPVNSPTTNNWPLYDAQRAGCPMPLIAMLNLRASGADLIRNFLWYDRYAEQLHSVVIKSEQADIQDLRSNYQSAGQVLNAFYRLVKVRKPDAFVWLGVDKKDGQADVVWLKAMPFKPDGLQIWNLYRFHSAFAETRDKYVAIVGADTPLVIAGFCGYKDVLNKAGQKLAQAERLVQQSEDAVAQAIAQKRTAHVLGMRTEKLQARQAILAKNLVQLGEVGKVVGNDLQREQQHVQELGYRGLVADWLLVKAVAQANKAAVK